MSMMKRHLEDMVEKIANDSGYDYNFIFDIVMEDVVNGDCTMEEVYQIAMERDY